jgi:glycosyltransferase involved in cell wall biosynthesis
MPVFNGERYIAQSVESILNQSYKNIELIVVNDGSIDRTLEILQQYKEINVINQENQGTASAINNGIKISNGEFIARIDSDDIAFPIRIEKQVRYLRDHPDVGLLGSGAIIIDIKNRKFGYQKVPLTDSEIRWASLFKSPFIHPSIMFRREIIEGMPTLYDAKFLNSQDYDLWVRLIEKTKTANIREPLLYYRIHSKNTTLNQREMMLINSNTISIKAFENFLPLALQDFQKDDLFSLQSLLFSGSRDYNSFGDDRIHLILRYLTIWDLYRKKYLLSSKEMKTIQDQVIVKVCQLTFFPPISKDSSKVIQKLDSLDSSWPLIFLRSMPYAAQALFRERVLRKV